MNSVGSNPTVGTKHWVVMVSISGSIPDGSTKRALGAFLMGSCWHAPRALVGFDSPPIHQTSLCIVNLVDGLSRMQEAAGSNPAMETKQFMGC